ncbi:type I-E CRISPR-associated protein Cse1/CasA [Streptomyces griseoaurantiacus]|uniref:type I-E CRISPR-associated protein Cse1/CasA n=1 Tax=Streptomyces griseoaurantiacus TaxID=68213 RepID=UPI0034602BD5
MTESVEAGAVAEKAIPSFDLTSSPWIEVLRHDGTQEELSLRQLFAEAGDVRRVVGEVATQEFALLRLLLAVTHDALRGPRDIEEWAELWEDPECLRPVQQYLVDHRGRFDLLHPEAPFFQTAGLRTAKDEVFSLNRIVADVPNGEPFFTARMPTVDRLTFAEAARWVVHAHAYDTSGIKTGAVGDSRVKGGKVYPLGTGWAGGLGGVFAEGETLRETLLLNLVAADTAELDTRADDRPAWRREPCGPGSTERPATGPRDVYTWQSRRLRLHFDAAGVHGVVLGYGDPLAWRNAHRLEPMTAWRRSTAQEKKLRQSPVYLPREHDPARSAWRGIASLVADRPGTAPGAEAAPYLRPGVLEWIARLVTEGHLERNFLVRARVIGTSYGTQQSVIDEVVDDHLTMPVVLLHQQDRVCARQAIGAAEEAERAVRVLGDLAADLARAAGGEQDGPRSAAQAVGFDALESPYRTWLSTLAEAGDPFEQRGVWQREVRATIGRLGDRLVTDAGEAAWQGRTVVDRKGTTHWLSVGLADTWFRVHLAKAVGDPGGVGTQGATGQSDGEQAGAGTGSPPRPAPPAPES